jgi:putative protease
LREKGQVFDLITAWTDGRIDRASLDTVIVDFEFGADYEPSITALKEAGIRCGIATTRILKPKEYTNLIRIERLKPNVILIRNLGSLHYFTKVSPFSGEFRGDFSLNATNHLTVQYLREKGLASVAASYDLSGKQVADLLAATDASKIEITAHQYMPSFHMEHCVFAAFLSQGSSFRDCGKPCEKHRVELKDQFGNRHMIKPDQECRNTMFNANSQSAARFVEQWQQLGLGFIRYEALFERDNELIDKIRGYQDLLMGRRGAESVINDLKLYEKYGLGEGAIAKEHEYKSRKKMT